MSASFEPYVDHAFRRVPLRASDRDAGDPLPGGICGGDACAAFVGCLAEGHIKEFCAAHAVHEHEHEEELPPMGEAATADFLFGDGMFNASDPSPDGGDPFADGSFDGGDSQ